MAAEIFLQDNPRARPAWLGLVAGSMISTLSAAASAADASRDSPEPEAVAPELVRIEGHCFQMGSPASEPGRDRDERQHEVCVDDFFMGRYEVTNREFRRFKPGHDSGSVIDVPLNEEAYPVVNMSWNDAVAYAEWLSQQTGERYRLPTEAEWEYAARGGTTTSRYWGEDLNQACYHGNVLNHGAGQEIGLTWSHHDCEDGYAGPAPVGSLRPNDFGLHDMLGNAWEWTCSIYQPGYSGEESRCAGKEMEGDRVLRGGSWMNLPRRVRSAHRDRHPPARADAFHGFRLVKEVSE